MLCWLTEGKPVLQGICEGQEQSAAGSEEMKAG